MGGQDPKQRPTFEAIYRRLCEIVESTGGNENNRRELLTTRHQERALLAQMLPPKVTATNAKCLYFAC